MIRVTRPHHVQHADHPESAHHYRIAGQALVFQSQLTSLREFEQGQASDQYNHFFTADNQPEVLHSGNARLAYQGLAPFNGTQREFRYWRKNGFSQIDLDDTPICHVDLNADLIHILNDAPFDDPINLEVVTGPALVTLLAKKHVYCMHAGAVSTDVGVLAMVGESGVGKSTLSRHKDSHWAQISDDILPLRLNNELTTIHVVEDFPQLKLPACRVVAPPSRELALDFLLRLAPQPTEQISFKVLSRTDALLQIVRHTVAARLFDQNVMREHARFAKRMSGRIPVIEVNYPRNLNGLAELRDAVMEFCSSL